MRVGVNSGEQDFVAARTVEKSKVAGVQNRLAAVLPRDAAALQLQLKENRRLLGARHVVPGVAHDLRVRADFRQTHVVDRYLRYGTVEIPDIRRFGQQRRQAFADPIVPERKLAARIHASR
jgi:hypothetical protein